MLLLYYETLINDFLGRTMVKNDQKMSFCSYSLNCQFHHSSYQKKLPNFFKSPISREIREIDWLGRVFSLTAFLNLEHFGFSTGFFLPIQKCKRLEIWRSYSSRHSTGALLLFKSVLYEEAYFSTFLINFLFFF